MAVNIPDGFKVVNVEVEIAWGAAAKLKKYLRQIMESDSGMIMMMALTNHGNTE